MAMKIPLSFAEDEKDLYEYLKSKLSPSIYVKELLIKEIRDRTEPRKSKYDTELNF